MSGLSVPPLSCHSHPKVPLAFWWVVKAFWVQHSTSPQGKISACRTSSSRSAFCLKLKLRRLQVKFCCRIFPPCHLGLESPQGFLLEPRAHYFVAFLLCSFHFAAAFSMSILTHILAFSSRTRLNKVVSRDPSCFFILCSMELVRGRVTCLLHRTALRGPAFGVPHSAKADRQSMGNSEIYSVKMLVALSSNFYLAKHPILNPPLFSPQGKALLKQ